MISMLVISLVMASMHAPAQPTLPDQGLGRFLFPDLGMLGDELLQLSPSRTASLQGDIEMFERHLREAPSLFTPEGAASLRHNIATWREDLYFMKQLQREMERYQN